MDIDNKFTWSSLNLYFPEWSKNMSENERRLYLPEEVQLNKDGKINATYRNSYLLEIYLNQEIPKWMSAKGREMVERMYKDLSQKVYEDVVKQLDSSYEIFEKWRDFVMKLNRYVFWTGNLQDRLGFENVNNEVFLYDCYRFYTNHESEMNRPTEVLKKVSELPKDSLNEKWMKYYNLNEKIDDGKIIGKDLNECIKNADEIYRIAEELKALDFN